MAIQIHYWTDDVERMLAYYVEVLGFDLAYRQPAQGRADFCILKLCDATIMFAQTPSAEILADRADRPLLETVGVRVGRPGAISVYVGVEDVGSAFADLSRRGAKILEPLWSAPWGLEQFSVVDPDGNITTFHSTEPT